MKSKKTNKSVYVDSGDWTKALSMGVNISAELARLLKKLINKKTCESCGKILLLLLVLSCGKKSGGNAAETSPAPACSSGALTNNYATVSGATTATIRSCTFTLVDAGCTVRGLFMTTSEAAGIADVTIQSLSGTCAALPSTTTCSFNLANSALGLTCVALGINTTFYVVP